MSAFADRWIKQGYRWGRVGWSGGAKWEDSGVEEGERVDEEKNVLVGLSLHLLLGNLSIRLGRVGL